MSIEDLREKTINFWIRLILRIMAWVILAFYMVYRIIIPVMHQEKVFLDKNDGWVMIGCLSLLLAIEGVKMAVDKWLKNK